MTTIATLALIWIVAFAIFFFPARMIGAWIVRLPPVPGLLGVALNVAMCFMIAKLVVVIAGIVLLFGRFDVLPHFNKDPMHFGLFFVAALLFVPAFAALIAGYLRARKTGLGAGAATDTAG